MLVAGTLQADQELIQNVVSVMQGAEVAYACSEDEDQIEIGGIELTGRDPPPSREHE